MEELYKKGVREVKIGLLGFPLLWAGMIVQAAKDMGVEILIIDSVMCQSIDFVLVEWDVEELPDSEVPWGMLTLGIKYNAIAQMRRAFKSGAKDVWSMPFHNDDIRQMLREIKEEC